MTARRLQEAAARLARVSGLGGGARLSPMAGGANNRVYRLDADAGPALVKHYDLDEGEGPDRLTVEFGFASFAWTHGIGRIPRPLGLDREARIALYEFVEGAAFGAHDVDDGALHEALDFMREVSALGTRPGAGSLPPARESCFRVRDHLATVERRVSALARPIGDGPLGRDARRFAEARLQPTWGDISGRVMRSAQAAGISLDAALPPAERCLSPSDFGFHNALREADGRIRFFDFEYAGWDDPAKLVGDFFCQVAVPVPRRYYGQFADSMCTCVSGSRSARARFDLLLPVYEVKWVCILLNDFLPAGARRRRFARGREREEDRLERQLRKASRALDGLLDRINEEALD